MSIPYSLVLRQAVPGEPEEGGDDNQGGTNLGD